MSERAQAREKKFGLQAAMRPGPEAETRVWTPCVYWAGERVCAECLGVREKNFISVNLYCTMYIPIRYREMLRLSYYRSRVPTGSRNERLS